MAAIVPHIIRRRNDSGFVGLVIINGYLKGEALPMTNNMVTNPLVYVYFRSFGFLRPYGTSSGTVAEILTKNPKLIM